MFIGKKLKREWFETSFEATLRQIRPDFPAAVSTDAGAAGGGTHDGGLLASLFHKAPTAFYKVLAHCNSGDVARVGTTCTRFHNAVFGAGTADAFREAGVGVMGTKQGTYQSIHSVFNKEKC